MTPRKNVPMIFMLENASERLDTLRDFIQTIQTLFPLGGGFRESVLAVSLHKNRITLWLVPRYFSENSFEAIVSVAEENKISWIDLKDQNEEETEQYRERVVKGEESYQIFSWDQVNPLLDIFLERRHAIDSFRG